VVLVWRHELCNALPRHGWAAMMAPAEHGHTNRCPARRREGRLPVEQANPARVTFPLQHHPVPAERSCPQVGSGASARQPAGRLPTAKAFRLERSCRPAGHGWKAPST